MNIEIKIDTTAFDRKMSDFPGLMADARKRALQMIGEKISPATVLRISVFVMGEDRITHLVHQWNKV